MSLEANQPEPSFAEFPIGAWSWDFSDDAMQWDEAMCHVFGIDPGTFGGASDDLLNLVHPGDRAYVANSMVNSVESGAHFEWEFRIQWPDGSVRSVVMSGEAIRDEHGKAHGMTGTCEISNHENVSGLTASMERTMFAALMDNLPDCIYLRT